MNKVFRPGKSKRDKASGAEARRLVNRDARDAWHRKSPREQIGTFPSYTCNGKKNRQKVGKPS